MKTFTARNPYLGTDEEVAVRVQRGQSTRVTADFDGVSTSTVTATVTCSELVDDLVHESLVAILDSYNDKLGSDPSPALEAVWEKSLREAWVAAKTDARGGCPG